MLNYKVTIALKNDTVLISEGKDFDKLCEVVKLQIQKDFDIIIFGNIGVSRQMIEYYTIEDVVSNV